MALRSVADRSAVKLFDAYIQQGIETEKAIVLTRASLGLSKRQTEDALRYNACIPSETACVVCCRWFDSIDMIGGLSLEIRGLE